MSDEAVRVAAVQATPVILDAEASVEKACESIGEAAAGGAKLVVLPEVFVSIYPSNAWARDAASFSGWDELWERMWASSMQVPGPLTERLATLHGRSDDAGPGGSAYISGWYGYVDKDLRAQLGLQVRQGFSRRYCGGGEPWPCRAPRAWQTSPP